jgi:hypothetical protein
LISPVPYVSIEAAALDSCTKIIVYVFEVPLSEFDLNLDE